jgi:hypothetical protein
MSEGCKRCNYCKVELPIYKFSKNRKDEYNKSCDECRVKQKAVREKNKCEHNRIKSTCKDCGGASICEHNRIKSQCKDCGGASICEHNRIKSKCKECGGVSICKHNRQKSTCKECGGVSICKHNRQKSTCKECNDPIKLTIKNWIKFSKESDIKKNRYTDECKNNFIDYEYCTGLVDFYKNCYHCRVKLQYIHYQDDLATIERLDNTIGHMKLNCVIACRTCNLKKVSNH